MKLTGQKFFVAAVALLLAVATGDELAKGQAPTTTPPADGQSNSSSSSLIKRDPIPVVRVGTTAPLLFLKRERRRMCLRRPPSRRSRILLA